MDKMQKLVTHNGPYHADDLFACAILQIYLDKQNVQYEVTRTRDEATILAGDFVFDVGGIYDASLKRFDHHQKGGAGKRDNGVPYSSVGLVWKHYGEELTGSKKVWEMIDKKIIQPIDADDNAMEIMTLINEDLFPLRAQEFLYAFRPTWKEEQNFNAVFMELLPMVKKFILRSIVVAEHKEEAQSKVEELYNTAPDKRIIVLDMQYPTRDFLATKDEPIYTITPRGDDLWNVKAVTKSQFSFENRKDMPKAWAGLRDEELQKVTGVPDAVFAHNGLFFAVAKSKEGAIKLAELALQS